MMTSLHILLRHKNAHGFSLIELMVTLGILAVILSVAVPSYTQFTKNARLKQEADGFFSLLSQARQLAISRGRRVYVCILDSGAANTECDGVAAGHTWNGEKILYTLPISIASISPNSDYLNQKIQTIGASLSEEDKRRSIVDEIASGNSDITLEPNTDDVVLVFSSFGRLLNSTPFWVAVCDDRSDPEKFGKLVGVLGTGKVKMTDMLFSDGSEVEMDCQGN